MSQSPPEVSGTDKWNTDNQEEQQNPKEGAKLDNHPSTNAMRKDWECGSLSHKRRPKLSKGSPYDASSSLLSHKVTTTVGRLICILLLLFTIIFILLVALAVGVFRGHVPWCLEGWVGYQRKCYYFSKAEENWANSQSQCSALGTSLAEIDSLQELNFLMHHKGPNSHWIGLRREGGAQPWKWVNGAEFNNLFNVTGPSSCAYLNEVHVSSSRCLSEKNWICSMPSLN